MALFPATTLGGAFLLERGGAPGRPALYVAGVVWLVGVGRLACKPIIAGGYGPRLAGFGAIAVGVLVLRPDVPDRVPPGLAELAIRDLLSGESGDETYYVSIDGEDPNPAFLRRFDDLAVAIRPASEARVLGRGEAAVRDLKHSSVRDRRTGERGTILIVRRIGRAQGYLFSLAVDLSLYRGYLNAHGRRATVLRFPRWRLAGSTRVWIS